MSWWGNALNVTKSTAGTLKESFVGEAMGFSKDLLIFFIIIILIATISIIAVRYFKRSKQDKGLKKAQQDLLRAGRTSASANKLNFLFTSVNGKKKNNVGKIIGYTEIETGEDKQKVEFSILMVQKNTLNPVDFYKIKKIPENDLIGDIVISEWNFTKDENDEFLIPNRLDEKKLPTIIDEKEIGVNTLEKMSPAITGGIKINPYHQMELRRKNLIKLPEGSGFNE